MTSAQRDDWVVTYTIEFVTPTHDTLVTEFYRGCRDECERICRQSGGGDDDRYRTKRPWRPVTGPAHEWDEFLNS